MAQLQENNVYYLLFHTVHDVLRAEKALKGSGHAFELVPVPRQLSSDCGVCVRIESNLPEILGLLANIDIVNCFVFDGKEYRSLPCS